MEYYIVERISPVTGAVLNSKSFLLDTYSVKEAYLSLEAEVLRTGLGCVVCFRKTGYGRLFVHPRNFL